MKKSILLAAVLFMVLISTQSYAQSPTDKLFDKYGAKDGFTTVHVTKELFSLFAEIAEESDDQEAQELQEVVSNLDYIRILMFEEGETGDASQNDILEDFKSELNGVKLKNFTELMTVKEGDELVKFMIMKEGKTITELLLLINQDNQAGFISITGNINLKSIAKISKSMNIDGLENLQKLQEEK